MRHKKTSAEPKQSFPVGAAKRIFRLLLAVVILAGVLWLVFLLVGRALCHISIGQIAELTNTRIQTESVVFRTDGSVSIEKLVISPYRKFCDDDSILKAEKVNARFSVGSILLLRPRLKEIDVNDFVFNAQYDLDKGRWNLSAMKIEPPKGSSGKMPLIRLKGGVFQYSKVSNGRTKVVAELPLDARFGLDEKTPDGYSFEITTAAMYHGLGQSSLSGHWKPGMVTFAGGIASTDVPALEMAWIIDVLAAEFKYEDNSDFSLKLTIKDMFSKHTIPLDKLASAGAPFLQKAGLFTTLQKFFNEYEPRGRIDIKLETSGNLNRLGESKMSGAVDCKNVAFRYSKFPYLIERLTGPISLTKNSVTLNNLSGRHKDVELFFNGWTRDFGPKWKYDIRITSNNMALDKDLYDAMGPENKKFWDAFSPTGFAAIDQRLIRTSPTDKKKNLTVELLGTDAVYENFPYPLKNLTGKLFFDSNGVKVSDVVSQVEKRKITLNGNVPTKKDTDKSKYHLTINVNNIELDSTLEKALSDRQRELYSQFSPAGLADGRIIVSGYKDNSGRADFIADLSFKQGLLKSSQFPQPISDITAEAVFTPDLINVRQLNGRYGQSAISLSGKIRPGPEEQQLGYQLSLDLQQTPLNDDLFALMPNSMERLVCELQPKGKVNLHAELDKIDPNKQLDYRLTVNCLGNSVTFEQFPYPLKDITGTLTITPQLIELQDIIAAPGDNVLAKTDASAIKLNGQITFADNVFSTALLHLDANDIYFDQQLGRVLPERVQPLYRRHMPGGLFNLDFESIKITNATDGEKYIDFTGDITLKKCRLTLSGARTEWNTVLQTKGSYGTRRGFRNCRIATKHTKPSTLDVQGKSFTNFDAEISYDNRQRNWTTKKLVADCYGGRFAGKFEVKQPAGQPSEFLLEVGFNNVDLRQFLSDTPLKETPESGYTTGKMNGSLSTGAGFGRSSSRIGRFRLMISDMQVGELSPMAKLLLVLRPNEPADFAFDRMFVDSYIRQNELFVRNLDISGDSLAFKGSGSMDLQTRDINLILTARGKRLATADPSIFQALTEGLGQAVVRMEVTGSFYNPQVKTKTFPLFKDSLEVLGAGR